MAEIQCPKCKHSVRVQEVRSDDFWIRHYECGRCGYKWVEITDEIDDGDLHGH